MEFTAPPKVFYTFPPERVHRPSCNLWKTVTYSGDFKNWLPGKKCGVTRHRLCVRHTCITFPNHCSLTSQMDLTSWLKSPKLTYNLMKTLQLQSSRLPTMRAPPIDPQSANPLTNRLSKSCIRRWSRYPGASCSHSSIGSLPPLCRLKLRPCR